MNRSLQLFRTALFAGLLTASARALEWKETLISVTPEKGAEVVRAKFEYRNSGKKPVQILGVRTSCGCTEATMETSEVAPGASGAVYVLFTIGNRTGLQEKEITLLTDESNKPTKLTLKVQLPEAAPREPGKNRGSAEERKR